MNFTYKPCRHRRRTFPATPIRKFHGGGDGVSARKLVAWLWELRFMNNSCNGHSLKCKSLIAPLVKLIEGEDKHCYGRDYCVKKSHPFCGSNFKCSLKNGFLLKFTMEEPTKWGLRRSRISNEKYCFYSIMKLLEDQAATVSVASAAQAELARAQLRIHELQAERLIVKKNFERLQRKIGEERNLCQIREHEKLYAVIVDLKNELKSERKNCRKMEIFNSKLVDELLKAKASVEQSTEAYEKEKKAKESVEEVCNELTNKITEYKVDFEVMKMETIRIQEQLEEERKMLQMAEVWREERVQMKLIDAKLALEDKYSELSMLVTELESFLRCKGSTLDVMDLRNAEMIRQAAKTVNVEEMEGFSYEPPKSSDIYSIFEEVKQMEAYKQANEMVNKLSTASHEFSDKTSTSLLQYSNDNREALTNGSLADSTSDSANNQFSKLRSKSAGQIMQKHSSASKLRKSSLKKITSNESSEMHSGNTSSSVVTTNQNRESHLVAMPEQWSSPGAANPHVIRAMKGCIGKPKTIQNKT